MRTRTLHMAALSFLLVRCASTEVSAKESDGKDAAKEPSATEVFALKEGVVETSLRVPGELIAFERVDLYAKVSSFVQRLYVDVGSEVKTGQLLATLEAPELGSQLAEAESKLQAQQALYTVTKATYERTLETSKTPGTISKNDLEQAEARMSAEAARLKAAQAAHQAIASIRSYLEMRAPFAGVISARNVSTGAYVGPSGRGSDLPLFTLQQQNSLRLAVSVPEANVGYLSQGNDVSFMVKARPGELFSAKVSRLAGALDTRLRAERVEINVDNSDKRLLPGMVAEVILPLAPKEARYVIPKSALVNSTTGTYVVRVEDAKAHWLAVHLGRDIGDKVEIFGKLGKGDTLARMASEELRDGSPLTRTKMVSP